jgi:hypothetical protein
MSSHWKKVSDGKIYKKPTFKLTTLCNRSQLRSKRMRCFNCSWFTIETTFLKSFLSKRSKFLLMAISKKTCKIYVIQRRVRYFFWGKRRDPKIFQLELLKTLRKRSNRKWKKHSFQWLLPIYRTSPKAW